MTELKHLTASELADAIESGELLWVNKTPEAAMQCCAAFWMLPNGDGLWALSDPDQERLCDLLGLDPYDPVSHVKDPGLTIGAWNDAPERTKAEVVAVLRQVAGVSTNSESTERHS